MNKPDTHRIGRLFRSSAVIRFGTATSRLTGFLRVAAIAYALGFTRLTDTFNLANETPNIVYELLLGGVLTAVLVPVFVDFFERDDDEGTNAILNASLIALIIFTFIGILLTPAIVHVYTFRLSAAQGRVQQQAVATSLLRMFMPQMFFYGLTALLTALLQARRRFAAAAFAPMVNNIVVIGIFLALPHVFKPPFSLPHTRPNSSFVWFLGLGVTAGIAAMALVLIPAVKRAGVHWHPRFIIRHPAVRKLLRLSAWTIGYVIANQIALWVILVLANGTAGGVSAYLGAYLFFMLPYGLLAVAIMTALTPEMASAANSMDTTALRWRFSLGSRLIVLVMAGAAALYVALALPIVRITLDHGNFAPSATHLTANTLAAFAFGLVPFAVYLFGLRVFYAQQDTKTPFLLNCAQNIANIVLAIPMYHLWGVRGLAFAFTISYAFAAALTLWALHDRIGSIDGRHMLESSWRIGISAVLAGLLAWFAVHEMGATTFWSAIITGVVGGVGGLIVFIGGVTILKTREVAFIKSAVKAARHS